MTNATELRTKISLSESILKPDQTGPIDGLKCHLCGSVSWVLVGFTHYPEDWQFTDLCPDCIRALVAKLPDTE